MNVLHVNTYEAGGAGKACLRLHENLLKQGVDSNLLVLYRSASEVRNVHSFLSFHAALEKNIFQKIEGRIRRLFEDTRSHEEHLANQPAGFEWFTAVRTAYDITLHPLYAKADIVHLHWVGDFLDFKTFFRNNKKRIVWTMQDMNPITGGCHYSSGCTRFTSDCHDCPQLQGTADTGYAQKNLQLKKKSISGAQIHMIASSGWLTGLSKESLLFSRNPHSMIFNGSDPAVFDPIDRNAARDLFGIPKNKTVILFIANLDNPRKGYQFVRDAFRTFSEREDVFLCVAGESKTAPENIPNCRFIGKISDEKTLNAFYSAGDILLIPSLEDDLPNTIIEALLCGTPVIGFPVGGIGEMLMNDQNGFLCPGIGVAPLTQRIRDFLSAPGKFNRQEIRKNTIQKFSINVQVKKYIELYNKMITN